MRAYLCLMVLVFMLLVFVLSGRTSSVIVGAAEKSDYIARMESHGYAMGGYRAIMSQQ
jgi:hypothetical protein